MLLAGKLLKQIFSKDVIIREVFGDKDVGRDIIGGKLSEVKLL